MSENLDHTSGGTFATDDIIDQQTANTKFINIQASAPSPSYDGQPWVDTDDDPVIIRVMDKTNTQWMTYEGIRYVSSTALDPSPDVYTVGELVILYNTGTSKSQLIAASNNGWVKMIEG